MLLCVQLVMAAALFVSAVSAKAHYTGYEHGPSSSVGLDIVLGVEDADPADHSADYHEYINSLAGRPMVPFRWYPYVPVGRPYVDGHKPGRWPEYQPGGGKKPSTAHKPTILYLEGQSTPGVEGRPNRPEVLPDLPGRPDHLDHPDRPDHLDHPDRPDRPGAEQRPPPPLSPPVDLFVCPDRHSCSDAVWERQDSRLSRSWTDRGCFCDAECRRYGDCCRDAPALQDEDEDEDEDQDEKVETGPEVRTAGENGDLRELAEEEFVCRSVRPFSSLPSRTIPAEADEERWYMLAACPREFDGYDNKVRCEVPSPADEDPLSVLPVTSAVTNTTYSSLFCAMCHNDTADLAFWQLSLRCPAVSAHRPPPAREVTERLTRTASGWGLRLHSGRVTPCEVTARPPAAVQPRACRVLSDHCPRSSPLSEACRNHTAVVYAGGRAFRNVYCLLCAGRRPGEVRCGAPCGPQERPAGTGGLRLRLQLQAGQDERCGPEEVRDPFSGLCRSIVCSRLGFTQVDGVCVRTEDDAGREDRGEDGDTEESMHPDDDLMPAQGLVDSENAIDVDIVSELRPGGTDALMMTTENSAEGNGEERPEEGEQLTEDGSGAAAEAEVAAAEEEAEEAAVEEEAATAAAEEAAAEAAEAAEEAEEVDMADV